MILFNAVLTRMERDNDSVGYVSLGRVFVWWFYSNLYHHLLNNAHKQSLVYLEYRVPWDVVVLISSS